MSPYTNNTISRISGTKIKEFHERGNIFWEVWVDSIFQKDGRPEFWTEINEKIISEAQRNKVVSIAISYNRESIPLLVECDAVRDGTAMKTPTKEEIEEMDKDPELFRVKDGVKYYFFPV